jgi:ParB family transcriptional regulator, chromosome partitioning protein
MARRRLTPGPGVPRAEHAHTPGPVSPFGSNAPIARVAADAAGTAAARELAVALETARDSGRLVLDLALDAIAPDHLARDRLPVEDAEMQALRESIRAHGQRTPIEVTPLVETGATALPYGLISGWRRLNAFKALHAETGENRFSKIQALVRRPETAQDAYMAMVEENEIRLGLSQYERARVAALATERGVFPDEEAALKALFATASRPKRSRIRAFLEIYHALDGSLRFPAHLPERLGLALVARLRAGETARIAAALARENPETPEAEQTLLADLVRPQPKTAPPQPSARHLRPDVTLEQSLRGASLTLRLQGPGVTPDFAREVDAALRKLETGDASGT